MPEHYIGPVTGSTSHALAKATQEAPASSDKRPVGFSEIHLGWECLEPIDCGTVPDHFKNKHGIANMGREVELVYTTTSVTSVSTTSDTTGCLPTQTKPSHAWEDELVRGHREFRKMILKVLDSVDFATRFSTLDYYHVKHYCYHRLE
ncbi:hypothetical protein EDC04DRAFT_2597884 [Pisolithus marmoratus]|nr:hypothetical protein EDC04DRAFT_2597884 [Pisolithus marmoratus]